MVNHGASTGCVRCRKRKIKCDESEPGCRRCWMIKKPCPGYDRARTIFVHPKGAPAFTVPAARDTTTTESAFTQSFAYETPRELAVVRAKPLSPTHSHACSSDPCELCLAIRMEDSGLRKVPLMLSGDIEHQSMSLFYVSFISGAHLRLRGNKWPTLFETLPEMLAGAGPDSCLNMSVKALVLANWYAPSPLHKFLHEREPCLPWFWALPNGADARNVLQDEPMETTRTSPGSAATIRPGTRRRQQGSFTSDGKSCRLHHNGCTSTWTSRGWFGPFMGYLEPLTNPKVLTGDCMLSRLPEYGWQAHTDGTMKILAARYAEDPLMFSTTEGRRFFLLFSSAHFIKALYFGHDLPKYHRDLTMRIWKEQYAHHTVTIRLVEYLYIAIRIRAVIKRLLSQHVTTPDPELYDQIIAALRDAKLLEASMDGWDSHHEWRHPTSFPYDIPLTESFDSSVQYYIPTRDIISLCSRYYLTRMKLHESLIDGLNFLSEARCIFPFEDRLGQKLDTLIYEYEDIISWAVDRFLGAAAFALGEVSNEGKVWSSTYSRHEYDWSNGLPELDSQSAIRLLVPLFDLRHSAYVNGLQRQGIEILFSKISREMRLLWAVAPGHAPIGITVGK